MIVLSRKLMSLFVVVVVVVAGPNNRTVILTKVGEYRWPLSLLGCTALHSASPVARGENLQRRQQNWHAIRQFGCAVNHLRREWMLLA